MKTFSLICYFIVLIVLVVAGISFAKDNSYLVSLSFFGAYAPQVPLWVVVLISFFAGVLASVIMMSWELVKVSLSRKKYKNSYHEVRDLLEKKADQDSDVEAEQ